MTAITDRIEVPDLDILIDRILLRGGKIAFSPDDHGVFTIVEIRDRHEARYTVRVNRTRFTVDIVHVLDHAGRRLGMW